MKIGILLLATDKYISFAQQFINSADKYFLPKCDVEYILFTNRTDVNLQSKRKINIFHTEHKPWPLITLLRYHTFLSQKEFLENFNFLYYCDVDMTFIDEVELTDVISSTIATIGAGYEATNVYYNNLIPDKGDVENNRRSTAFINFNENTNYFMGGFNGGLRSEFLKMSEVISSNINKDLSNNIIAKWHDESHINRYFVDNPPGKIITTPFCIGERPGQINCRIFLRLCGTKIVALYKDHSLFQIG